MASSGFLVPRPADEPPSRRMTLWGVAPPVVAAAVRTVAAPTAAAGGGLATVGGGLRVNEPGATKWWLPRPRRCGQLWRRGGDGCGRPRGGRRRERHQLRLRRHPDRARRAHRQGPPRLVRVRVGVCPLRARHAPRGRL